MDTHQHVITVAGDVGTYKAALCKSLKQAFTGTGIRCSIHMKDEAETGTFNVFVTTSKSEFHADRHKDILYDYDLVLNIDQMTEEEATQCTIEQFAKWVN